MLGTRYEEYTYFADELPFTLKTGIVRTPETKSPEANWHENLEIQMCTGGSGWVTLDETTIPVKKNDVTVVNSGVLHHTGTKDAISYDCLIVDAGFCRQFGINPPELRFSQTPSSELLAQGFSNLVNAYENYSGKCRNAVLGAILLGILIELRENCTAGEDKTAYDGSFDSVKKTIKFIRENYPNKISLDEIAQNALTDKYALSRNFKRMTKMTIFQYLNAFRCKKAAECISDGISVSDAAVMCGFCNMSFFTKTFRQYMGCLPSKYKNGGWEKISEKLS